jgi:hypothetical protein
MLMSSRIKKQIRRLRLGRGHNAKGRSRRKERFVKLMHWMLSGAAWCALTPAARALYVELAQRYNGFNNGEIAMSVREAAWLLHIAKDTASKTFHELEEKGFIKRNVCGSFNWKLKHATTWILTEFDLGDVPATKEFARWQPGKAEPGPTSGTSCPRSGTGPAEILSTPAHGVLDLGPWTQFCTVARSQLAAHI